MANTDSIWSKKFVQGRTEHAYEEHLPSCSPPLPPKLWPTPAALGLSNVSRRLSCGSHCPSICDAQRSFWSLWKALQQNIQSYFFKSHILLKLMSNSKCRVDFYKLSFHTNCSSWFQLHLWRRKKKWDFILNSWNHDRDSSQALTASIPSLFYPPAFLNLQYFTAPPIQQLSSLPTMPLPTLGLLFLVPSLGISVAAAPGASHLPSTPQNRMKKGTL